MSSEIFYDKAFIRVEEKYIPVVNHGSSNCFEFDSRGREIPEKTWSVLNHPYMERMLFTADEITELTRMVAVECIDEIAIYEDRKIEVSFTHWQDYSALSEQVREYYQENHKEVV